MGWEAAESTVFVSEFPPLQLLTEPQPCEVIGIAVHEAVWNITQPETDLGKMLRRYEGNLQTLYDENSCPQTDLEKIVVLEWRFGPCLVACTNEKDLLHNHEFNALCDMGILIEQDWRDYFV